MRKNKMYALFEMPGNYVYYILYTVSVFLCFRMIVNLYVTFILFLRVHGKILRVGKHFDANFAIIDRNSRIKSNCINNHTSTYRSEKCVMKCIATEQCKTFNHHEREGICELLSISKFDSFGLLRKERYWTHYETDYDSTRYHLFVF